MIVLFAILKAANGMPLWHSILLILSIKIVSECGKNSVSKISKRNQNKSAFACVLDYSKNVSTKGRGVAALTSSRELAYLSTVVDARELNCRVRNGSGWNLSAMAA